MVDKRLFVDLHSLLNSVTLNFLEEVDPDMLSRSSCDVEAVLGKNDNPKRKSSIISLNGFLKRSATKFIHIVIAYMEVQTIRD